MIFVAVAVLVDVFDETESDLGEIEFADHYVADCDVLVLCHATSRLMNVTRTLVKRHMPTLDLRSRVARIRHIVHQDINIRPSLRELAVNKLEHQESRFCHTLAHISVINS